MMEKNIFMVFNYIFTYGFTYILMQLNMLVL